MENNPFVSFVSRIRQDTQENQPILCRFGRVMHTNPLEVETEGITLSGSELVKSSHLTSFEAGDTLLLLPIENEQRHIILVKVVSV